MDMPLHTAGSAREQLGQVARQLREGRDLLGVLPALRQSAQCLPDTCRPLSDVERRSPAAAEELLTAVQQVKRERSCIATTARTDKLPGGHGF